ncbi:MAG: hypothetical protein AB7O56_06840 [Bauldia sp.]
MKPLLRVIAPATGAMLATSAMAQPVDPQIAALVEAWVAEEGADFSELVRTYGGQCLTPVVGALAEAPRQAIIAAGGIEAGIAALQTTDPAAVAALMPGLQECIETLFVGEQVLAWLQAEGGALTPEALQTATFCYMDAVRPLPTESKQMIVQAENFEAGANAVVGLGGTVGTELAARLETCS